MGFPSATLSYCPTSAGSKMLAERFCLKGCLPLTIMVTVTGNLARVSQRRAAGGAAAGEGGCGQRGVHTDSSRGGPPPWPPALGAAVSPLLCVGTGSHGGWCPRRQCRGAAPLCYPLPSILWGALRGCSPGGNGAPGGTAGKRAEMGKKGAVTAPTVPGTAWGVSSVHRAVRAVCTTLFCRRKGCPYFIDCKVKGLAF